MPSTLLFTTVVGSYPQPDWLIDRGALGTQAPPRIRLETLWRVPQPLLEQAQDDATLLAIREMERAGIDIVSDGEMRRESYSNRFATALDGIDIDHPGEALTRSGKRQLVPRVVGPIRRRHAIEVRDVEFLRRNTDRRIKITLPGPFTMAQQAKDEHYRDEAALAMAYAEAVNAEAKDLKAAGADVIQLDEPYLQAQPDKARDYAIAAINRALEGVPGPTVVHLCFGYAYIVHGKPSGYSFLPELAQTRADQISIEAAQPKLDLGILGDLAPKTVMLGVLDLGDPAVESAEAVAARIRGALKFAPPERIIPAPDCGMKYLPRATAFGKLKALADGSAIVRRELQGRA
ncbi:MAG TPA: uroporphyrinogen decarboxylase family protein [Stellaceae bacterium]|jgi:5-methyltetrahydropteroyltriglutamate--homocysteine methyltransferase|nr:uroporphyrinogen decarboxylase family protein [Stellaceae bacterium]